MPQDGADISGDQQSATGRSGPYGCILIPTVALYALAGLFLFCQQASLVVRHWRQVPVAGWCCLIAAVAVYLWCLMTAILVVRGSGVPPATDCLRTFFVWRMRRFVRIGNWEAGLGTYLFLASLGLSVAWWQLLQSDTLMCASALSLACAARCCMLTFIPPDILFLGRSDGRGPRLLQEICRHARPLRVASLLLLKDERGPVGFSSRGNLLDVRTRDPFAWLLSVQELLDIVSIVVIDISSTSPEVVYETRQVIERGLLEKKVLLVVGDAGERSALDYAVASLGAAPANLFCVERLELLLLLSCRRMRRGRIRHERVRWFRSLYSSHGRDNGNDPARNSPLE